MIKIVLKNMNFSMMLIGKNQRKKNNPPVDLFYKSENEIPINNNKHDLNKEKNKKNNNNINVNNGLDDNKVKNFT